MHKEDRCKKFLKDLKGRRYIWFFALFLFLFVNTACFDQTVIIRIVNATNESPVKKKKVYVSGISGEEETQEKAIRKLITRPLTPDLHLLTDGQGVAQFELPKNAPAHFYVRAQLSGPVWDCTCLVRVSTEEVMQKGFMVGTHDDEGSRSKTFIQPKPWEILFRVRPTPWWARVLWPLLIDHRR